MSGTTTMASRLQCTVLALLVSLALGACRREVPTPPPTAAMPTQPVAPVPEPTAPASQSPIAETAVAEMPAVPVEAAPPHAAVAPASSAACLAHTAPSTAPRSVTVHRWVDDAGITHYSDQAPASAAAGHRLIEVRGLPPIAVNATGYDVDLPDQVQQRATTDALAVQRVLRDALGVGAPSGLTLKIVFVGDADPYARLIGDPLMAGSVGAYASASRSIYLRMQAHNEATFAVLRHEITHALVHESIGNLPTSLNEGLAEYFGRYRVSGLGGQIDLGADRDALQHAAPIDDGSDALVEALARDGADFYAGNSDAAREQRYVRAYALVALLMRDAPGRAALAAVLAVQQADPCRTVAVERVLDARYPGGLRALATAWAGFMRNPPEGIQAY